MKKFICALLILVMISSPVMAMTTSQKDSCNVIIHGAASAAAGSSIIMAQAPGADNIALAVAIGGMVIGLANVFDLSFGAATSETIGVSVLGFFSTMIAARIASQWILGWIPFLGNTVNAATMFGMVEWIGWECADAMDKCSNATKRIGEKIGGTIVTINDFLQALSGEESE